MKVIVLNKREFAKFMEFNYVNDDNVEEQDMLIVSINNIYTPERWEGKNDVYSYFKRNHFNVLIMHFPDFGEIAATELINKGDFQVFNDYKAKKIFDFVSKNKDKHLAIVHCSAGISRSGAVGVFIHDLYGTCPYEEFRRRNPRIIPNGHVLSMLRKQLREDNNTYNI